jgi:hypothetical protein
MCYGLMSPLLEHRPSLCSLWVTHKGNGLWPVRIGRLQVMQWRSSMWYLPTTQYRIQFRLGLPPVLFKVYFHIWLNTFLEDLHYLCILSSPNKFIHTYIHSRFIPEGVAETYKIFLRYTHILPKLLATRNTADVTGGKPIAV